ncbi:hypothetical protein [Dietzia timorensis]|uniref:Uncharacterized protein n=1 Tax=Dietzia timorensis TaxID=499555 RepID=A0A173LLP7_9ACTN|nr:hypothetical protein [Dietzia timorensis]ANI91672.1 Hypothetical protein BJL86_0878 [Dietzia timorensis]
MKLNNLAKKMLHPEQIGAMRTMLGAEKFEEKYMEPDTEPENPETPEEEGESA